MAQQRITKQRITEPMAERKVATLTLTFADGLHHEALADELRRIARLVHAGYQEGEITRDNGRGWWTTTIAD